MDSSLYTEPALCRNIVGELFIYSLWLYLLAMVGLGFTLCAGPGSCRQAILWSLDEQRWTAEADGENNIKR